MDDALDRLRSDAIATAAGTVVYVLPEEGPHGRPVSLIEGFIPLLVNFTDEDKAAKGLRVFADGAPPPVPQHFSAVEMVRDHALLLLTGESGAGKTSFARHLAWQIAAGENAARIIVRNEAGDMAAEVFDSRNLVPLVIEAKAGFALTALIDDRLPGLSDLLTSDAWRNGSASLLLIVDRIDALHAAGPQMIDEVRRFQAVTPHLRVLLLGDSRIVRDWSLPADLPRHELLPLLQSQRRAAAPEMPLTALSPITANPALFGARLEIQPQTEPETEEALADAWAYALSRQLGVAPLAVIREALAGLTDRAFEKHDGIVKRLATGGRRVSTLLAAHELYLYPPAEAVALYRSNPLDVEPLMQALARRLLANGREVAPLLEPLMGGSGDMPFQGALLATEFLPQAPELHRHALPLLLSIVEDGRLSAYRRERAARALSRLSDPRDLQALADIPGGAFTFGSATHPNSTPAHPVTVDAFRIGRYPVVNADYARFVAETGRLWRSPEANDPERRNAPATDLTWHDANAYCAWLTLKWRAEGRISAEDVVRLPTEPEWERAARGDQPDAGDETIVYPWGIEFEPDACNSEEAGFNRTVAVGLFPKGRSPFGVYDMAGEVWEWTTTLWGDDMTTPSFQYPYRDDGREHLKAGPKIRRVLRGGCFSSGKLKACTTYRGSLEPDGFWRGNGFRIAVSPRRA
ncbi:SUMF1/EgtB/PvdO family nonheme iron enzyme [Rhizobium sp. SGZ-381]|uniref:SUMF1/EgtB/PvdO family nonheme iron enzyme n=1 Tax=Rhizobium sp. SGZ-381 TaxID=3342800 RepID=UPI00366EEF81